MLGGRGDVTGDDWDSLEVEDFLMGEADPDNPVAMASVRQEIQQQPDLASADRQADAPTAQGQLIQRDDPQMESVSRQTGSTATQMQLDHPGTAAAQGQPNAEDQDWQLVAARWWRQQRQQIQPQQGRLVGQTPQPRQQQLRPQRRMQDPERWNFGDSGDQSAPQQPGYRQRGFGSRGGRQVTPEPSEPPVQQ